VPESINLRLWSLRYRFAALAASTVIICVLLFLGLSPAMAMSVVAIASAGWVEVSCRLTDPHLSPIKRGKVVILILVLVTHLVRVGYSPELVLLVVLTTAWCMTLVAGWLTAARYRPPRVTIVF
jgi:hypothetical protein